MAGRRTGGLGKGLDALIPNKAGGPSKEPAKKTRSAVVKKDKPTEKDNPAAERLVKISSVEPNLNQPRRHFDEDALLELSESIKQYGVLQPLLVSDKKDYFEIIAGERRWRASQLAGLETVPVYIREADDQHVLEMSIVENIQRQDLNAIEVALSLQRLVDECSLTQDSLGERIAKKRSTVANYMRLLKLPVEVQLALREELISMGHARALAGLDDPQQQIALLKKIVKKGLSVRQAEEQVQKIRQEKPVRDDADEEFPESYVRLVDYLEKFFTQEISIKKNNKGGGKIVIGFESDADIEAFIGKFNEFKK